MKPAPARPEPGMPESPGSPAGVPVAEREFERDGEPWLARPAGSGAYGTGRAGSARLLAIHFFRAADPAKPLREALLTAGAFDGLDPSELRVLCDRATPIPDQR